MVKILKIPADVHALAKAEAARRGLFLHEFVIAAIRAAIGANGRKSRKAG